jgi:hypothetical protein
MTPGARSAPKPEGASMPEWPKPLTALGELLERTFAGEVPAELAPCEFDCRHAECSRAEWESCEHRRRRVPPDPSAPGTPTP